MADINKILNGEAGLSVRDKLNEVIDKVNASAVVVPVGDATVFDPAKPGGYPAGSIVSYRNEASLIVQFQTFAIYVANSIIPVGVSPEDSSEWLYKGDEYVIEGGNTSKIYVTTLLALRSVSDMKNGDSILVGSESQIYEFVEGSELGVKPFAIVVGSWFPVSDFQKAFPQKYVSLDIVASVALGFTLEWETSHNVKLTNVDAGSYMFVLQPTINNLGIKRKSTILIDCTTCAQNVTLGHDIFPFHWKNSTGLILLEAGKIYEITVETSRKNDELGYLMEWRVMDENVGGIVGITTDTSLSGDGTVSAPLLVNQVAQTWVFNSAALTGDPGTGKFGFDATKANIHISAFSGVGASTVLSYLLSIKTGASIIIKGMNGGFHSLTTTGDSVQPGTSSYVIIPITIEATSINFTNNDKCSIAINSAGGGGLSTLTEDHMLIGGVGNVPAEKTAGEVNTFLGTDDTLTHIDGADEQKHTTNQIIEEAAHALLSLPVNSPLHTVISSIINFLSGTINSNELDTTGWDLTEQRLAILERTVDGVQFKGAALLLDIFAPPGVEAALRDNTGWANETKTLTGDNSNGQLGEKGAMIWLNDRVFAQCISSVKAVSGSATYNRNRSVDVLDPTNSTQDAAIANQLDRSYTYPAMTPTGNSTDLDWNLTTQTKVLTNLPTRWGMWFVGGISGDGYTYHCYLVSGNTSYWKRTGTPSSISRVIYAATHPTLTGRILAHDFATGAYVTQTGDEVTYADQTFYDATTRGYFIKMINGNWEKIR